MSLNGVSNTVFPNTLNGLDSLNVTNITIDGQTLASLFVPYTGALSNVDLNNKSLTGINGLTAGAVTSSGLIQGGNLTATSLTTTNTLKINSVPAGTAVKNLATDASGNVIEIDLTSKYVPYTGATANVNLNARNLSNVNTLGVNSLATVESLRIQVVPSGTQVTLLAYDASGNVIQGTVPLQSLFNITATSASVNLFPAWLSSTSGGSQPIYADSSSDAILYNSGTKILTIRNLKLSSVPAGTQTKLLAVDAAGNVIEGTVTIPPPTQLLTTATSSGATIYYPTFVTSQTTGDKSYFVERAVGYSSYFQETSTPGASGTWYLTNVRTVNLTITGDGLTYDPLPPTVIFSGIAWALGLNSAGQTIKYAPGSATEVQTTNVNFDYNLLFTNAFAPNSNASIFIDVGLNIKYNPGTDTFTVPNLTVGSSATIPGYAPLASPALTGVPTAPTAAPGTNTTQIATTAFVLANAPTGSFLPLAGGTMTGTITTTASIALLLSSAKFITYTYIISDSFYGTPFLTFITPTTGISPVAAEVVIGTKTRIANDLTVDYITSLAGALILNGVSAISFDTAGTTRMFLNSQNLGVRMGSMFDFSVAGDWTNSNSLFVTAGGYGGSNPGVGVGYSTSLDVGLLVSIAPNVAWKGMRYKAANHQFYVNGNTSMAGVNGVGLYADNAGYMTNSVGAAAAGLAAGYNTGDLIFFANSSLVMRFYTGSTCRIAMGANQIFADTIVSFTSPAAVSVGGVSIWRDTTRLNLSVGTAVPTTGLGGNTNIIFGYECGRNITSGVQNVLMGVVGTGDNITTGNQNTLIGYQAGRIISTGSLNTAIGQQALAGGGAATCTGNYNCAIGHFTLTTLTSGSFNSALGVGAGTGLTTGNFCTYIGTNAQPSAAGVSNEVVISNTGSAVGRGGNSFFSQAVLSYNGANSNVWNTISDRNIKKNIVPLTNELHKIMALRPVHFEYKETGVHGCSFIAQEWKEIFPELHTTCAPNVYEREVLGLTEVEGILTDIVPHIVRAMQEQQAQIEQQNRTIQGLLDHVAKLTEAVNKLTLGAKGAAP